VTRTEALELLGVQPGCDRKTARRAYLRGIKAHKPEQDPEGFQRVRAAWELLQEGFERGERPTPRVPVPEAPAAPAAGELLEQSMSAARTGFGLDSQRLLIAGLRAAGPDIAASSPLAICLTLYQSGQFVNGSQAVAALEPWLEDRGGVLKALNRKDQLLWLLLGDLRVAVGLLPPALARALVSAVWRADNTLLLPAVADFLRRSHSRAMQTLDLTEQRAPGLGSLLRSCYQQADVDRVSDEGLQSGASGLGLGGCFMAAVFLFWFLRALASFAS